MNAAPPPNEPLETPSALLPADPPARAARWAGWLLLAVAAAALLFVLLVPLPETVRVSFVLVPAEGDDPVRSATGGTLAAVSVSEGQEIAKDAELFRVRSDEIRQVDARRRQVEAAEAALAERMRRNEAAHKGELELIAAQTAAAEQERTFRRRHYETVKNVRDRAEKLLANGLVSQVDFLRHELELAESEKNRATSDNTLMQLGLQRQAALNTRARQQGEEAAEAARLKLEGEALRAQLAGAEGDTLIVRAPFDAVVLSLAQRTPGSVIAAGSELCRLARRPAKPVARLLLPETGVPRLAVGQPVRLEVAAYPYQRHGVVEATLTWVSPAQVAVGNTSTFIALANPDPRTRDGLALRVGMGGEARVIIDRRTLAQRGLEPLRALREKLR